MKNVLLSLVGLTVMMAGCGTKPTARECVLDRIVHLEDSVYYRIDSLPPLCAELGIEGKMIDIGGCRLYCEVQGEGMPLVVINGGPGGTHHYFHPSFGEAEKFCKVIYYDQRGCGRSDFVPDGGYTFRQAADDLEKLRQALGIEKWVVCGYSYGGALAQYYTVLYPRSVAGMVLIGADPLMQDPALSDTRQSDYISDEEQQRIDSLYDLYRTTIMTLKQLIYNINLNGDWKRQNFYRPTRDEQIRSARYEWVNDLNFNYMVWSDFGRYDFKGVFDGNPIPTLICEGKWDLTWMPEKAEIIRHNHPNAQFVLFENAGHAVFSDEPARFFPTLHQFVEGLKVAPAEQIATWQQHADGIITPQVELFAREARFFDAVKRASQKGLVYARTYYKAHKRPGEQLFTESGILNVADDYQIHGQLRLGVELLELCTEAYPDSPRAYDGLGNACLVAGNSARAKEAYQHALELDPNYESARKMLERIKIDEYNGVAW